MHLCILHQTNKNIANAAGSWPASSVTFALYHRCC